MSNRQRIRRRRDYARGYSAGRRNLPYAFIKRLNPDVARGWGTGQSWLYAAWDATS